MTNTRPPARAKQAQSGDSSLVELRARVEAQIAAMAEPILAGMGYELVRVQLAGSQGGLTLQVMAERQDKRAMRVEDCRAITHALDSPLDTADIIPSAYALEVSSPGIDRPLTRAKDYSDWAGFEAQITLREPLAGRKNLRGKLQGVTAGIVRLAVESGITEVPLELIAKAQLVLTDELIKATAAREAEALSGQGD